MKYDLDTLLKTTYHNGELPTDHLNQTVLHSVEECERMRQVESKNKKEVRNGSGRKLARVAVVAMLIGSIGYIGASATGYVKPISEVFQSIFHSNEETAELADSMGHFVGLSQTNDGVKITVDAMIGDGQTYAVVFNIEKEDGTAFDFANAVFDEDGTLKINSEGISEKSIVFQAIDEKVSSENYSSLIYFYDEDSKDSVIQMVSIFDCENVEKGDSLTQKFTDLALYDAEKDDYSMIAKGTWEFKYSLNFDDTQVVALEKLNVTLGSLSATQGNCRVSPIACTMKFVISKAEYDTNYKEKDEAEDIIGPVAFRRDVENQGIYVNLSNGEKMEISKDEDLQCEFDDETGFGEVTIKKVFNKVIPVENIESVSIGNQNFSIKD